MASSISFPASFLKRVARLGAAVDDMETELLPILMKLMDTDNTEGLLAGLDKDSRPLAPLKPRTIKYRKSETGTADPHAPPLIPARMKSRAIANYMLGHIKQSRGVYTLVGAWKDVLSKPTKKRGPIPFLPFHFEGAPEVNLPVRDIRGVREAGRDRIRDAMKAWLLGRT